MREVVSLLVLLALTSCCPASTKPAPSTTSMASAPASAVPTPSASSSVATPTQDPVAAKASALITLAAKVEPDVTTLLKELSQTHGAEMVKLEFRLKTQSSTERKLNKLLADHPELTLEQIRIDDALRYTMRVDDEPAGRYVAAVKATLAELESKGHVVQYVKNYWPPDDNYSGINSVLQHSSGLFWELQFHTSQSLEVQTTTRPQYEEMRDVITPIERQRELFDDMTTRWNAVPIPVGALKAGALHSKDQVRERARP